MAGMFRLNRDYIGWKTNERRIPAGVYHEDDERVYGAADYLVNEVQIAEWIDDLEAQGLPTDLPPAPVEVVTASVAFPAVIEFDGRTLNLLPPDASPEMLEAFAAPPVESFSEPKSLEESWTIKDLEAFAGEFGIDLGKATRKGDIATIVEAWCESTDFDAMDLAVWYESRHAED
jgi:hypothetical protein